MLNDCDDFLQLYFREEDIKVRKLYDVPLVTHLASDKKASLETRPISQGPGQEIKTSTFERFWKSFCRDIIIYGSVGLVKEVQKEC